MPKLLLPVRTLNRLLRRRRAWGGDRRDEVWSGVYVLMPLGNNEHQGLIGGLTGVLGQVTARVQGARVFPGVNVTDQANNWEKNYRCPDVAVFLPGNPAEDRETHWLGGPDFAVEIISPHDRARRKFEFYAKVGVRELLLVNRRPWGLELYRRGDDGGWTLVGKSAPDRSDVLPSAVLPVKFRLLPGDPRPRIEVLQAEGAGRWSV